MIRPKTPGEVGGVADRRQDTRIDIIRDARRAEAQHLAALRVVHPSDAGPHQYSICSAGHQIGRDRTGGFIQRPIAE